jgi:predicted flap endonuclease-1-like 5' DNA nuclease
MNKRMQKKVAKRTGGSVRQHSVATPQRKHASATPRRSGSTQTRAAAPETVGTAKDLARALVGEVQERAAGAVEHLKDNLKDKLADTEQRAEQLLAKVPGVGPAVAKKLHDLTNRE